MDHLHINTSLKPIEAFRHLKPKVRVKRNRLGQVIPGGFQIISAKNGSKRNVGTGKTFEVAISRAIHLFRARVMGRALRYERLRRIGVPEAQ